MAPNTFYNEDTKLKFLSAYPPNSKITYKRLFKESIKMEKELNKDLYNFSGGEVKHFFHQLKPISKTASRSNGRKIKNILNGLSRKG